jgi:A/G-specific adenine glycosylase
MSEASSLVKWFRANARPLPWRTKPRDPYATLVSELMAQQTQLDRVVPKFEVFMLRFPSLSALAAATEDEVLELWSGLGYYRRARLLHRLAGEVAAGSGELPTTASDLEELPGIGPYTAAAVASMVHGEAVPLMDGNVARVGSRVLAESRDPRKGRAKDAILGWVEGLMTDASPGEVNEALMELGATICTPAQPDCGRCPLNERCQALLAGDPLAYPPPRQTRSSIHLRWLAVVIEDPAGRWLLRQVTEGPILRGLWLPPFAEIGGRLSLDDQVRRLLPFQTTTPIEFSKPISHSITHRRIEVSVARVILDVGRKAPEGWKWVNPDEPTVPTSSLLAKMLASFSGRHPVTFPDNPESAEGE